MLANRNRMRVGALCALLVVAAGGLEGCAAYKMAEGPLEVAYVLGSDYHEAQLTAINILNEPGIPESAKQRIRNADKVGTPAVLAVIQASKDYTAIENEIATIRAGGGQPSVEQIASSQRALMVLRAAITNAQPLVEQLLAAIRSIR